MKSLELESIFKKGKEAFEKREYKKAINYLTEVVDLEPDHVQSLFILANIFHIRGEISKAIKAFKKVLDVDPNHTDASISLSVLYNDIGHYQEAKTIFNKASQRVKINNDTESLDDNHINKKFSLKHYEMAELYLTYNRLDEALFEYNKSLKLDPENLEARVKVSKVYAKKGFVNKSFDELTRLKNEYPNYLPGRIALGVLLYGKGDVLLAQTEWQKVISLDPTNSDANMYLNLSNSATETTL